MNVIVAARTAENFWVAQAAPVTVEGVPRGARVELETAHGTSMINYNFGGIKGVGPSGLTARAKTPEVIDGKAKTIVDGFRAYRTLDEGAEDYVRLLKGHFSGALSAADAGSMDGFAHELKRAGYYTASEHDYASALRSIAGQKPSTAAPAPSAAPASSGEDFATTAQLMTIFDSMRASSLRILAAGTTEDGST